MNKVIRKNKDKQGKTRFCLANTIIMDDFKKLVDFLSSEVGIKFNAFIDTPVDTVILEGIMHNKKIIFVLNDIDEVTFFAEDEANAEIAEKIAAIIEAKFKHNILPTNNEHYKYNRIFIFDEKRENTKIININQNNGDI